MSGLDTALADYLGVRQALGFKFEHQARELPQFVAFMEAAGATTITTELALAWATQRAEGSPVSQARRLGRVRGFARHMVAIDPDTEVPPSGLLPARWRRADPYIYTDAEVAALLRAARRLRPALRAATFETVIGLLAATGMRSGEALRLDRDHIDAAEGVITVWNSKFNTSRALPVHPTTMAALARYGRARDKMFPQPVSPAVFVSMTGSRLVSDRFHRGLVDLVRAVGLDQPGRRRPRPHDLRHRFAVRTLIGWYRSGLDVEVQMPLLTTYLGHARPEHSYWYLSGVPELLLLASQRLERAERSRP
jgi:integrase/recombinase XerD